MIYKSIFLLMFTLLFTACVERGYSLKTKTVNTKPTIIGTKNISNKKLPAKEVIKSPKIQIPKSANIKKEEILLVKESKIIQETDAPIVPQELNKTNDGLFSLLSEETKNNISGFFIILITIIILL